MRNAIVALVLFATYGLSAHAHSDDPELEIFVKNVLAVDAAAKTVTLPLYEGDSPSGPVWYIITESSRRSQARALGVNWSPRLVNALGTRAVQDVTNASGRIHFAGTVDFSPARSVVPDPVTLFPPTVAEPGAVADSLYSPLFTRGDGVVVNAPHVANSTGLHDKVVSIDINAGRVTIALTEGFYEGDRVLYISTEASVPLFAALQGATYTPNLAEAPAAGSDDEELSARQGIVVVANGETGADNPDRQGLQSALSGDGDPLNVIQEEPGGDDYSPLWDGHLLQWTDRAVASNLRAVIDDTDDVRDVLRSGLARSGGDGPKNPSIGGLRAAGVLINCPVIAIFD